MHKKRKTKGKKSNIPIANVFHWNLSFGVDSREESRRRLAGHWRREGSTTGDLAVKIDALAAAGALARSRDATGGIRRGSFKLGFFNLVSSVCWCLYFYFYPFYVKAQPGCIFSWAYYPPFFCVCKILILFPVFIEVQSPKLSKLVVFMMLPVHQLFTIAHAKSSSLSHWASCHLPDGTIILIRTELHDCQNSSSNGSTVVVLLLVCNFIGTELYDYQK